MVRIEINTRQLVAQLESAIEIVSDFRQVWNPLIETEIQPEILRQFDTQGEGRWPRRRDNLPHPLLVKTGELKDSYLNVGDRDNVNQQTALTLDYGSMNPYARYHETGTSRIPARPVVSDLSDAFNARVVAYIDGYINRKLRRLR